MPSDFTTAPSNNSMQDFQTTPTPMNRVIVRKKGQQEAALVMSYQGDYTQEQLTNNPKCIFLYNASKKDQISGNITEYDDERILRIIEHIRADEKNHKNVYGITKYGLTPEQYKKTLDIELAPLLEFVRNGGSVVVPESIATDPECTTLINKLVEAGKEQIATTIDSDAVFNAFVTNTEKVHKLRLGILENTNRQEPQQLTEPIVTNTEKVHKLRLGILENTNRQEPQQLTEPTICLTTYANKIEKVDHDAEDQPKTSIAVKKQHFQKKLFFLPASLTVLGIIGLSVAIKSTTNLIIIKCTAIAIFSAVLLAGLYGFYDLYKNPQQDALQIDQQTKTNTSKALISR